MATSSVRPKNVVLLASAWLVLLSILFIVLASGVYEAWGSETIRPKFASRLYLPLVRKDVSDSDAGVPRIVDVISLPAGSHPHGIALDIEGRRAFVGNHHANTLSVLDTVTLSVVASVELPGAAGPNDVVFDPRTAQVYVTNRNSHNVSVVSALMPQHDQNVEVGQLPAGLAIANDRLYVANFGSNSVSVINTDSNLVSATLDIGLQPARIAVDTERESVYLSAYGSDKVYAWQGSSCCLWEQTVPRSYGITYDPITGRLYAVSRGDYQAVTPLESGTGAADKMLETPGESYVAAINPRTGHLFVAAGNAVLIYDRRDGSLITSLPVNEGANEGVAVDASRNLVYITSGESDTVTVIQDMPTLDIAYTIWHGSGAITVSDDSGAHHRLLTTPDLQYGYLSWRPDGKHLAFSSYSIDSTTSPDIYRIGAGGQGRVKLTDDQLEPSEDLRPDWSPAGDQIAWQRNWQIWVMDEWGENKRRLTPVTLRARSPKWSPNGQWIAFIAFVGEHEDIFLISVDGEQMVNLTDDPAVDLGFSWSPNGDSIVFESDRASSENVSNWELYRLDLTELDQLTLTRLTYHPANDHGASWSHDGTRIAFLSDRGGEAYDYRVYLMNPDGEMQQKLTWHGDFLHPLVWSPNDQWLLTSSYGELGYSELFRIDTVSGDFQQLTQDSVWMYGWPTWRPDTRE